MVSCSTSVHVGELSPFLPAVTLIILMKNQHIMNNHKGLTYGNLFTFRARRGVISLPIRSEFNYTCEESAHNA